MRFLRFTNVLAAGAAGLFSGLAYHNISNNRQFLISAAKPVILEIDGIISKDVEQYVNTYTPVMKYGFPSYDTLRVKENFVISYDKRNKVANWVMEHLTSGEVEEEEKEETRVSRSKSTFYEDNTIHSHFRATLSDYKNSGYDRGHLAAAANHKQSQRAMDATFILSNVTPQNEYFNQGIWHSLEEHVRDLVQKYGSVYVCSGPLYLPRYMDLEDEELMKQQATRRFRFKKKESPKKRKYVVYEVIGENDVAVPTHFFKIIVCECESNKYDMEAYVIPNQRVNPRAHFTEFKTSREAIERAAGFLLFHQLPSEAFRYINGKESSEEESMEF